MVILLAQLHHGTSLLPTKAATTAGLEELGNRSKIPDDNYSLLIILSWHLQCFAHAAIRRENTFCLPTSPSLLYSVRATLFPCFIFISLAKAECFQFPDLSEQNHQCYLVVLLLQISRTLDHTVTSFPKYPTPKSRFIMYHGLGTLLLFFGALKLTINACAIAVCTLDMRCDFCKDMVTLNGVTTCSTNSYCYGYHCYVKLRNG